MDVTLLISIIFIVGILGVYFKNTKPNKIQYVMMALSTITLLAYCFCRLRILISISLLEILAVQLYYLKDLIIPTRKSISCIITVIIAVAVLAAITYVYGSKWYDYISFVIASATLISMSINHGISSKGFLPLTRGKYLLEWNEVKKITIVTYNNKVKLNLSGNFNSESMYFEKEKLDKIIEVLKENSIPIDFGQ